MRENNIGRHRAVQPPTWQGWARTVLAIVIAVLAPMAHAQQTAEPSATPAPTPTPQPTPIPAADIPDRAARVGPLVRKAVERSDLADELDAIRESFEKERSQLVTLTDETRRRIAAGGPASIVEEAQNSWLRSKERLDGWLTTLRGHSTAIDEERQRLENERLLWQLTESAADEVELPAALRKQVTDALAALAGTENVVRSNRDAVLTLQAAVARERAAVDEMLAAQEAEIAKRRRGIVGIDSAPLWKLFGSPGIHGAPAEQISAMWQENSSSIRTYVSERQDRLVRQGTFLVLLVVALLVLRRRAAVWVQQDRSLQRTLGVLERPLAAALIVTILLSDLFHPRAPRSWIDFVGLVILIAVLRLLPRVLPPSMGAGAYLLALVYFLQKIVHLAPSGNLVHRLALLALSVAAAYSCQWIHRKVGGQEVRISDRWRRAVLFGARLAFLVFVFATIANVFGAVGLTVLLVEGTLNGIYGAILCWVAAVLLRAMVRVALLTRVARGFGIVRLHADTVSRTLFGFIQFIAVAGWGVMTLRGFGVFDAIVSGAKHALERQISIGDFSFVPGDIAIFILVVWLTFKLSRLLRFVLETDVMPRMDLPRGVPAAIDRLSHYAVVVVGVMIAATAAGLDFSRINLIVGALGVGIGFGLQNIVNNFVSGLILLFERPIRVGDKLQLGQVSGVVKNIGMRASVVRTWEGAEVIVPNANLISAEVINWTLSDERRRVEIPLGVAYGTDLQTVLRLLLSAAQNHPEVLKDPEPVALFLGFGESSLDFELRAWAGDEFVRVASELRVAISQALAEAGIEIPFPQRDLHLRSVDVGVAGALSGQSAERRDEEET